LPFIEQGGQNYFGLTQREIALMCASHSGTDEQVAVLQGIQRKTSVNEQDLLCGTHPLSHEPTVSAMRERDEALTPNRHNCSGKHTGMLAFLRMETEQRGLVTHDMTYVNPMHPIQQQILQVFSEMCDYPVDKILIGIDGCSAPVFAIPLYSAALGYARLSDPDRADIQQAGRAEACRTVVDAMLTNPDMVGGPGRFDTRLMQVTIERIVSKGGAEGYQGMGLLPGCLYPGSPGVGIVLKVSDGDARRKVVPAIAMEVLRQLGVLSDKEMEALNEFGPSFPVLNWRKLHVGQGYPVFNLTRK
jgi:L-asparaginase II